MPSIRRDVVTDGDVQRVVAAAPESIRNKFKLVLLLLLLLLLLVDGRVAFVGNTTSIT